MKIRILIYLGKGISAAYSAAFRGVPTKEGELQLTVRNPLPTKVTLWGIGLDALVQGEVKPLLTLIKNMTSSSKRNKYITIPQNKAL